MSRFFGASAAFTATIAADNTRRPAVDRKMFRSMARDYHPASDPIHGNVIAFPRRESQRTGCRFPGKKGWENDPHQRLPQLLPNLDSYQVKEEHQVQQSLDQR